MALNAFRLPLTLLVRDRSGQSDSWNDPVLTTREVQVRGYVWRSDVLDPDLSGDVTGDEYKAAFLPPKGAADQPKSFHALMFGGATWEIIGPPEPKYSLARGGKLHHYEVRLQRAAA